MPSTVWYSVSPYGTGDIKTGSPNITISGGVATLTVAQTGNIGVGTCIEYNSLKCWIAPNRLGFDSGGTVEIKAGDKIQGGTSSATGVVRQVEVTSGSWAGGDAAGYVYFESTSGTWQDDEQINRIKPSSSSNVATVNGTLQGNIGNGNTQFVVKSATGSDASNQTLTSVTSIHHEYASLSAYEAGFTDSNHINNTDLTSSGADVVAHPCCYYDHDDQTADTATVTIDFGTVDSAHYFYAFTPTGGSESINKQRHSGKWNDNAYRLVLDAGSVFDIREEHVRLVGLQIKGTRSGSQLLIHTYYMSRYLRIDKCIVCKENSGGTGNAGISCDNSAVQIYITNSLFYDIPQYAINGNDYYYVYNNTIINCGTGINGGSSGYCKAINNIVDCDTCFTGTFDSNSDYNISSDTTAPGSNSITNATATFVDAANDDYHLDSTDTAAKDAGTDLSSDSNLAFSDDIDGDTRSGTWDIGADEYVASGGTTYTKTIDIDALIKKTNIETSTYIDSILLKSFPINLSIDSILSLIKTSTISTDALLKAINTVKSLDIDALLKDIGIEKTADIDAILASAELKDVFIDAVLKEIANKISTNIDAVLTAGNLKDIYIDSLLKSVNNISISTIDALLRKVGLQRIYYIDALLKKAKQKNLSIDAFLKQLSNEVASTIDSILLKNYIKSVSIDSLLKALNVTSEVSIDSLLNKNGIIVDTNFDAILQAAGTHTVITSIDALLKRYNIKYSCDLDAILQSQDILTLTSIDSILALNIKKVAVIDALLKAYISNNLYLDSILKQTSLSRVLDIDSILVSYKSSYTYVDAFLKKTILGDIVLDAYLQKSNTNSFYLDSLLSKIANININFDAVLTNGTYVSIDFDALLKKTKSIVGIIDAILIGSSKYVRYSFLSSGRDTTFLSSGRDTTF